MINLGERAQCQRNSLFQHKNLFCVCVCGGGGLEKLLGVCFHCFVPSGQTDGPCSVDKSLLSVKCKMQTINKQCLAPVLPKPEVIYVTSASGETEANCTARSRPAADITWDVGGDNRTLGPPVTSADSQGDGTTIVRSTLLFHSGLLKDVSVKCIIHHQGLRQPLTVPLNTNGENIATPHVTNCWPRRLVFIFNLSICATVGPATVILLSVCGVVAVLFLCLCICFCKCFVCTTGESGSTLILKYLKICFPSRLESFNCRLISSPGSVLVALNVLLTGKHGCVFVWE